MLLLREGSVWFLSVRPLSHVELPLAAAVLPMADPRLRLWLREGVAEPLELARGGTLYVALSCAAAEPGRLGWSFGGTAEHVEAASPDGADGFCKRSLDSDRSSRAACNALPWKLRPISDCELISLLPQVALQTVLLEDTLRAVRVVQPLDTMLGPEVVS